MKLLSNSVLIFSAKTAPVAAQINETLTDADVQHEMTNNIQKAFDYIVEANPCLVVIDTPSDDAKAIEFCKKIKRIKEENCFELYFLIDNNRNFEEQWNLFMLGADELGTRDTNVNLIAERIRRIVRPYSKEVVQVPAKGFMIDRDRYMVFVDGREIAMPRKEFELLMLLSSKPDKVFTREDIFRLVWGNRLVVGDRTIDVHVRKIREKIGDNFIVTVKGVGYKFVDR